MSPGKTPLPNPCNRVFLRLQDHLQSIFSRLQCLFRDSGRSSRPFRPPPEAGPAWHYTREGHYRFNASHSDSKMPPEKYKRVEGAPWGSGLGTPSAERRYFGNHGGFAVLTRLKFHPSLRSLCLSRATGPLPLLSSYFPPSPLYRNHSRRQI